MQTSEFPVITRYEVQGANDVIQTNAQLWQSFKQGQVQVHEFSTALRENMEGTYAMRRAYSGIRMAVRVEWASLIETAKVLGDIGAIGRDVVQMWQAYTIGQYRIERANRDVVESQQSLVTYQSLYNQYLRDFGRDSAYTKEAFDKLVSAERELKAANEAATKANNDMIIGFVGMGLEIGSIVATVIRLGVELKILGATMEATQGVGLTTGLGLSGLGAAALAAAPPIAAVGAAYWLAQQIQPVGKGEQEYASFAEAAADLGITFDQLKTEMLETVNTNRSYQGSIENLIRYTEEMKAQYGVYAIEYTVGGKYGMITLTPEEWQALKEALGLEGTGQSGIEYVWKTGNYRLHRGERVLNAEETEQYHAIERAELIEGAGQNGTDYMPKTGIFERVVIAPNTPKEPRAIVSHGKSIRANVTLYNTIAKEVDADAVAERAYRKILQKLVK